MKVNTKVIGKRIMFRKYSNTVAQSTPVFIVGLPRSGTTLLYQLLLNHFDCSYFTMWAEYYYRAPVAAYRVQRLVFPQRPSSFEYESEYGKMKDRSYLSKAWRPVEGHPIWHRWFPEKPTHCYEGSLDRSTREDMQSTIAGFIDLSGKPFLNKNTRNSIRLTGLVDAFPEAVIIVVGRRSLYVAQSLYIARLNRQSSGKNGNNRWWGTKPAEFLQLQHLDPLSQAVGQTRAIERELKKQLRAYANRYINVDYEEVCERPSVVLRRIQEHCDGHGVGLRRIKDFDVAPFPLGNKKKVSDADFDSIKRLLDQF
jgi:hypothetical protein